MCIWDLSTLERIKRVKGHTDIVNSLDISRYCTNLMCSSSDDCTLKVWDRRKRTQTVLGFETPPFQILSACFGATENELCSGGIDNDLKVWDMRKPGDQCLYRMKGHTDSVTGVALNAERTHVASNSMDNCVRVWDVRAFVPSGEQRCVNVMYGHTHNFEKVFNYIFYLY